MVVKLPPAYTTEPLTASVATLALAPGSQAVASPVPPSNAAMRLRACPPARVKVPPT